MKKDKHFDRSIGEEVEIKLYKAIDKQKEWIGILKDYNAEVIKIQLDDETEMEFPRSNVAVVRLTIDF